MNNTLTSGEVKALKKAEAVVYYIRNGKAWIKAVTKKETDVYKEQYILIMVTNTGWAQNASYVDDYTEQNHAYKTMTSMLKAGDEIRLYFYKDALTNDIMRSAGLHGDKLELQIHRNGNLKYTFFVGAECTYNNMCRMITA